MELPDNMTNASPDANEEMTWAEAQRLKLRGAYFNEVNIEQIRGWRQRCHYGHGPWCSDDHRSDLQGHLSKLILIDTRENCIVEADTSTKYIALSYVWGGVSTVRLTLATKERYMMPGALQITSLPHTIRDAISWTSALGERYLWVDCLCVVQDTDAGAMNHVLQAMGHIYATAELTIVAANGNHANFGLPGFGQLPESDTRGPTDDTNDSNDAMKGVIRRYWPVDSTWNSRGWTFQEALYSRRLLVFSHKHRIVWLCAHAAWTRLDHQKFAQKSFEREVNNLGWYKAKLIPMSIKSQHDFAFPKDWAIAVDAFTRRNLSFEEDFERAFAGAQHGIGSRFPGKLVHGLPQFFFDICLLWLPGRENHQKRRTKHPSWSWTGWTGKSRCKESWWPLTI